MTEAVRDRKREAAERAIATGGVPLDPYPGYLTWFLRQCVERGAGSGLDWLCRVFPERADAILATWCRFACEGPHLWAWREARARLEGLVARGEPVPVPLRCFALEPEPAHSRGPDAQGSRAVLMEFMARVLKDEGLDPREVNRQFGESFPSAAGKAPGPRLRKRRRRARAFVAAAFEEQGDGGVAPAACPRAVALECDWSDAVGAAWVLLSSRWPAFALLWEFWPEHRDCHLALWCARAEREAWVWDELRALFDHAVYCGWTLPPQLRSFPAMQRPANPSHPPLRFARWIRVAAIEARVAQVVGPPVAAQLLVGKAFEEAIERGEDVEHPELGLDLDLSTLRSNFILGRNQLKGVGRFVVP